jgi:ArsR family transcriptional regulator
MSSVKDKSRPADLGQTSVDLEGLERILKALASERRLQILEWLKDPVAHFPPQEHGDPIEHGACNLFIVDKLGVSQPAASRHLKVLADAGLVIPTRRKGWVYYRRNEETIAGVSASLAAI